MDTNSDNTLLKISACSYEGSLFGWNLISEHDSRKITLELDYGFNVIQGCLKAIAVSQNGKYLALGGIDEQIRIYNVIDKKSIGELTSHRGDITCLEFYKSSILVSGSMDACICIWRVRDWTCLHIMEGQCGPVLSISIHPSGKLALSVSKDKGLKLWNLMLGKSIVLTYMQWI